MPSTRDSDNRSLLAGNRSGLACGALTLLLVCAAFAHHVHASSIVYSVVYDGPAEVAADSVVTLEIRASFDVPLVATSFSLSSAGDADATVVNRSAAPLAANGLSYISTTSQTPFASNLPTDLVVGPLSEVLLDLDYDGTPGGVSDGVAPGSDILVESIDVRIGGTGQVVISLSEVQAATTAGSSDGHLFDSITIDSQAASVVIGVEASSRGDMNCDGQVNGDDITPFVTAMLDPAAFETHYPGCDRDHADMDENTTVDGRDIDEFVRRLLP